jgi:DNA polymerase II small subunit/DNA polymerase delta subunit B
MKEYIVRIIDYNGNIVDGLIVEAKTAEEARSLYIIQHYTAFADMYPSDKIVIREYTGD